MNNFFHIVFKLLIKLCKYTIVMKKVSTAVLLYKKIYNFVKRNKSYFLFSESLEKKQKSQEFLVHSLTCKYIRNHTLKIKVKVKFKIYFSYLQKLLLRRNYSEE